MVRCVKALFLALGLLSMATPAFSYHYGMAGCGLGALVFQDSPGPIQIVAITLNNLISPQTSAITSGTSNCYDSADAVADLYIETNKVALLTDISKGNGETLDGLAKIFSCQDTRSLGQSLKSNFAHIYQSNTASSAAIKTNIVNTIKNDMALSKTCVMPADLT